MDHGSENHLLNLIPNDRQPQQTETLQPGMALLWVAVITAGVPSAPSAIAPGGAGSCRQPGLQ